MKPQIEAITHGNTLRIWIRDKGILSNLELMANNIEKLAIIYGGSLLERRKMSKATLNLIFTFSKLENLKKFYESDFMHNLLN